MSSTLMIKRMSKTTLWYVITWNIWFGALILEQFDILPQNSPLAIAADVIGFAAAISWFALLFRLSAMGRQVQKDAKLRSAFHDDFMDLAKRKAGRIGYFGALFSAAALAVLSDIAGLSGLLVAELVILASVNAYLVSWLVFIGREDADD